MIDIIYDNRRSAQRALDRQPVNGFGVKLAGGFIVFRPYRDRWELARLPRVQGENDFFESPAALLNQVFGSR